MECYAYKYDRYICLYLNGHATQNNWTDLFKKGEKICSRFINAGSQTFFDVRIPNLKMTVILVDGQAVEVDEFRLGNAETYDVIGHADRRAYTIFAQSMDRKGFAGGTLVIRDNLSAFVPQTK